MISVPDDIFGEPYWRRVQEGEAIKTYYQAYSPSAPNSKWKICSLFSNQGYVVRPYVPTFYRAPNSFVAWIKILIPLGIKYLRNPKYLWLDLKG